MDRVIYTRTYKNGVRACDRLDKLRIKYGSGDNAVRVATQIRGHLASPFSTFFYFANAKGGPPGHLVRILTSPHFVYTCVSSFFVPLPRYLRL